MSRRGPGLGVLLVLAGLGPGTARAGGDCDPLEVRRTRESAHDVADPLTLVTGSRPRSAEAFSCRRRDVRIEGSDGKSGAAGVMASKVTGLLRIPDNVPLWLAGDREGQAAPSTAHAILLLEAFDAKGKPSGVWYVGQDASEVSLGGRVGAIGAGGPVDLREVLAGREVQFRVSALSGTGEASVGSAFLVPHDYRVGAEKQQAERERVEAELEAERLREQAERDASRTADEGPETPEVDRASVEAFGASTWTDPDPGWADQLVRVGDVDNCGFGFPAGFNPFLGQSTAPHASPFYPEPDDPSGTDRIMVGSGYDGNPPRGEDDYLRQTRRDRTAAQPLRFEFLAPSSSLDKVLLQLFVDDLQPSQWGGRLRVTLDGRRAPNIERTLGRLEQTSKTGKLVSVEILPEFYDALSDGELTLLIDDPTSGAGDGFAIDFAQLAINPVSDLPYAGKVRGVLRDEATGQPVVGALVSTGFSEAITDDNGEYVLLQVPAGAVVIQIATDQYSLVTIQIQLVAGQVQDAPAVKLTPPKEGDLAAALERDGQVELQGLEFPSGSAELSPAAVAALGEAVRTLKGAPWLSLEVSGHTDDVGAADVNRRLSQRRADSVVAWLVQQGIEPGRLTASGFGEDQPLRSNDTPAGKAANRRVELVVVD